MRYLYRQILFWLCSCMYLISVAQSDTLQANTQNPLTVNVDTGKSSLLLIADIAINGNKKTKPYIIERELPFKQGDYISRADLTKKLILAQQQVFNTSLFTEVNVNIPTETDNLVFISVDVKERWYLFPLPYFKIVDRNFNEWWVTDKASFDRVNYGLKFMQNNVSGRNDKLNLYLIWGYSRQISFRYEQPLANKSLTSGYSVGFDFSRQRELNYATGFSKPLFFKQDQFVKQYIRGEFSYLYRPAIKTRHAFTFAYEEDKVADTVLKLNRQYFPNNTLKISYPEISYSLQYFDVDYIAYPSKGFMGDFKITRKGWTNDMNVTQFEMHGSYTFPINKTSQLQFQTGGLIRFPFNQPYYNQQLFGYGDIFLRGLEYYVIDGAAGIMGRTTARKEVFSFTLKTAPTAKKQVTIPFKFYIKAFGDAGYAYNKNPGNSLLNNKLIYTYGAGIDMVTTYDLVIKLDYSFNQLGGHGLFLHLRTDF